MYALRKKKTTTKTCSFSLIILTNLVPDIWATLLLLSEYLELVVITPLSSFTRSEKTLPLSLNTHLNIFIFHYFLSS